MNTIVAAYYVRPYSESPSVPEPVAHYSIIDPPYEIRPGDSSDKKYRGWIKAGSELIPYDVIYPVKTNEDMQRWVDYLIDIGQL